MKLNVCIKDIIISTLHNLCKKAESCHCKHWNIELSNLKQTRMLNDLITDRF